MEWRAEGILLAVRRHGEHAAILDLFTEDHGRHSGVVRGGASRKMAPLLQPGAQLDATWKARLEDHLGAYTVDLIASRAADVMGDRLALAGLTAVCGLLSFALPERESHPHLYALTQALLDGLGALRWDVAYLGWEQTLLSETGFRLSLDACAVTGATEGLAYISPKTGRAVTAAGAGAYVDRLLRFSPALVGASTTPDDVRLGLDVTGYMLENHLAPSLGTAPLPASRARLMDLLARRTG